MAETTEANATSNGTGSVPDQTSKIDAAMDKVWAGEPEPAPEAKPEPEKVAESEQPNPDAEATPADAQTEPEQAIAESVTEPDAATEEVEQGDPLTPEEENLLRRQKASEDDIAAFRAMKVAQRNILLKPLRAAQHKLDTIFGMTKEAREAAIGRERQQLEGVPEQPTATVDKAVRDRLAPDANALSEFAKVNSLDEASVKKLLDSVTEKQAAYITELERDRQARAQAEQMQRVDSAAAEARVALVKEFPRMATDSEYAAIVNDPVTVAVFTAKVNGGVPVGQAMREAFKQQATLRYLPEITQKRQAAVKADRDKAVKNTPERTTASRGAEQKSPRPKNVDDAMAMVEAEMRGES